MEDLEADGFQATSPRAVLKQAFQSEIISDGHSWIAALEDRNLAAHAYNEKTALKIERLIRNQYFPALAALHKTLKTEVE